MTNAEIANQLRHKAADLHALADQLDPPVTATAAPPASGTWTPIPVSVALAMTTEELLDAAQAKQSMTGLTFTPAATFETPEEFNEHLVQFVCS